MMIQGKRYIARVLALLLMPALLLASCGSQEEPENPKGGDGTGDRVLVLTLSMDEAMAPSSGTRAATDDWSWGAEPDDGGAGSWGFLWNGGNEFDNTIDTDNVELLVYDYNTYSNYIWSATNTTDPTLPNTMVPLMTMKLDFMYRVNRSAERLGDSYTFQATVPEGLDLTKKYVLVVRASFPDGSTTFKITDLDNYIPMWGFTAVTSWSDLINNGKQNVEIDLLRAAAKISIMFNPGMESKYHREIVSGRLVGVSPTGYCEPRELAASQSMMLGRAATKYMYIDNSFHPIDGTYTDDAGKLKAIEMKQDDWTAYNAGAADSIWTTPCLSAYVPERRKTLDSPYMLITIHDTSEGKDVTYKDLVVDIKELVEVTISPFAAPRRPGEKTSGPQELTYTYYAPMNLIRNHWYIFIIDDISINESTVELKYTIFDGGHIAQSVPTFK